MNGRFHLFTVNEIPVYAELWFFALLAYYVVRASDPTSGIVFAACVVASVVVHELGHALVAQAFALEPSIVLHGWGGLCSHRPTPHVRDQALIIGAGPGLGLLGGLTVLALSWVALWYDPLILRHGPIVSRVVDDLVYIGVGWSFVNLLPVWPLDGGQLFRIGARRVLAPETAHGAVHGVGLLGALAIAGYSMKFSLPMTTVIGVMLAVQNGSALAAAGTPTTREGR